MYIYGLQAQNGTNKGHFGVDLESTSADVTIHGFVAHLSITLVYTNKSTDTLEVAYVFPVDAKAAVYSFEAKIEGRIIRGRCMEKKKAQEVYQDAVKQGNTAILGSEDKDASDVFNLSLGNIPPGKTIEINLKMGLELPVSVDGALTFKLPTVFNPRYCPADQKPGPSFPPSGSSQRVFPNRTQYSSDVKGEVRGSFKIAKVTSETDPINVRISDEDTTATVTQGGRSNFDHDWSFQVYYQTVHKAQCLQMEGDRSSTGFMKDDILMLNFFPEIPSQGFSPHNELIFIVDRSGSMGGYKMVKAKNTLLLFLKSLPPGCRFNIISFGSRYSSLFESSSERYTEETLKKALELQKSMDADMVGTEILEALKHVYSKESIPGYPRQVIVLTDGQVWNQGEIFDLISRHADETRLFSVGIGDGASTALVQGMAQAGRGRCEMVFHNNQLQTKVMGLVTSMLQEKARDLKVDCEVNPSQTLLLVPKIPPVIFGGQHLIMYARVTPKSNIKSINLTWKIGDMKMKCEIADRDIKIVHDSNLSLHRLAAKAQLKQWEREDAERNQADLVSLSVSSNVVCGATSFVGIDQDGKTIEEERPHLEVQNSENTFYSHPHHNNSLFTLGRPLCSYMNTSFLAPQSFSTKSFSFGSTTSENPQSPFINNVRLCSSIVQVPYSSCTLKKQQSSYRNSFTFGFTSSEKSQPPFLNNVLFGSTTLQNPQPSPTHGFSFSSTSSEKPQSPFLNNVFGSTTLQKPQPSPTNSFSLGSTSSEKPQPPFLNNVLFGSTTLQNPQPSPTHGFSFGSTSSEKPQSPFLNNVGFGSSTLQKPQPSPTNNFSFGSTSSEKPQSPFLNNVGFGSSTIQKQIECADELLLIVSSQNFDGSWNLSDCCKFVNCLEDDQVKKMQSQLSLEDTCLATVLSLALLELKFAPRKQEWHFVSLKGRMFLKANNVHDADALIEAASKQLRHIHETAKQLSNSK